jgi:hypothetical protein
MANLITEAQLKSWLNIDDSTDDGLLSMITGSASQMVRTYCGRSFEVDTGQTATARYFVPSDEYVTLIDDCWAVTLVETDDGDDGTYNFTWQATDWQAQPVGNIGPTGLAGWPYTRIVAVEAATFPIAKRPAVKVTAKWGWSALPTEVMNATLMMAAEIYKARSGGFEAFTADASFTPIRRNMLVRDALAPYRTQTAHDARFVVF